MAGAFLVAQSSLLLVGGRLGDRHGRRRIFLIGLLLFSAGASCTAVAPSVWVLIASRVVQGAGAGFLTAGALALVLPMFPAMKSAVVIGAWGLVGGVGAIATPLVGPFIVERSWRVAFVVVGAFALLAIWFARRLLAEQPPDLTSGPTDRLGWLLGPPALGLSMLVISRGSQWGWTSAPTLVGGAVSVLLLAMFVRRSFVADAPLLDLQVIGDRWYATNLLAGICQQAGFFAWWLTAPLIMSEVWGWGVREIGLALAATQLTGIIGSPLGGQIVLRLGHTPPIVLGAFLIVASQAWLIAMTDTTADTWGLGYLPAALAFGLGCGTCGTITTGGALAALPQRSLGAGNSIIQLGRRMGGALGVTVGFAFLGEAGGNALLDGARRVWTMVLVLHLVMLVPLAVTHARERSVAPLAR